MIDNIVPDDDTIETSIESSINSPDVKSCV